MRWMISVFGRVQKKKQMKMEFHPGPENALHLLNHKSWKD
jgi:hypothetical protein